MPYSLASRSTSKGWFLPAIAWHEQKDTNKGKAASGDGRAAFHVYERCVRICKPNFVCSRVAAPTREEVIIYLGLPSPAASSGLPVPRSAGHLSLRPKAQKRYCLALHPVGFA